MSTSTNTKAPSYVSSASSSMIANSHIVMVGLGCFFGLILFILGIHIYSRFRNLASGGSGDELERSGFELSEYGNPSAEREAVERRRRRRRHRRGRRHHRSRDRGNGLVGLDKWVLEQIPTFVLSAEGAIEEELECAVCLEEFASGETGRVLPKCRHCFHVECIDMWLFSHTSCPLCRCEVATPPLPTSICFPLVPGFASRVGSDDVNRETLQGQRSVAPTAAAASFSIDVPSEPRRDENTQQSIEMSALIISMGAQSPARSLQQHSPTGSIWECHPDEIAYNSPRQSSVTTEDSEISGGDTASFLTIQIRSSFQPSASAAVMTQVLITPRGQTFSSNV